MTPEEIRNSITSYVDTNWTATSAAYPNHFFDPPENDYWIRLSIKFGSAFEGELGPNGVGVRTGVVMIDIFAPSGSGSKQALTYAATIEGLFRRKALSGIIFGEAETREIGDSEFGYQTQVTSNFYAFIGE